MAGVRLNRTATFEHYQGNPRKKLSQTKEMLLKMNFSIISLMERNSDNTKGNIF